MTYNVRWDFVRKCYLEDEITGREKQDAYTRGGGGVGEGVTPSHVNSFNSLLITTISR